MGREHCLICYAEVNSLSSSCSTVKNIEISGQPKKLISKDLHVIFLLRNLLEIPRERLVDYLTDSGGESPSSWCIRLCSRCKGAVDTAKGIYGEMLKTTQTYRSAREEIVGMLRESECIKRSSSLGSEGSEFLEGIIGGGQGLELMESVGGAVNSGGGVGGRILEETRTFVSEHNYGHVADDPFKIGDLMAESLYAEKIASQKCLQKSPFPQKLKRRSVDYSTFGLSMLHLCKDPSGAKFQCPICSQIFSHLSKMKFHAIRVHLDRLFDSAKLPNISDAKFQSCCKVLLENTTPECISSTVESTVINSCSHCGKGFTDKRYLHCHWLQHHYEVLAQRLQNLQKIPDNCSGSSAGPSTSTSRYSPSASSSKSSSLSSSSQIFGAKRGNIEDKPLFTCSQCLKNFIDIGELKVHIVVCHTEHYFPPAQFNPDNVPMERFRTSCQNLFRDEKYKVVGNESFACPFCEKTYTAKRYVYVHMIDAHFEVMGAKLLRVLKSVSRPQSSSSSSSLSSCGSGGSGGGGGVRKDPGGVFTLPLPYVPNPMPMVPMMTLPSGASVGQGTQMTSSIRTGVKRRINTKIGTNTFICIDCGSKFGHSSVLTRHRKAHCPVRRQMGLIHGGGGGGVGGGVGGDVEERNHHQVLPLQGSYHQAPGPGCSYGHGHGQVQGQQISVRGQGIIMGGGGGGGHGGGGVVLETYGGSFVGGMPPGPSYFPPVEGADLNLGGVGMGGGALIGGRPFNRPVIEYDTGPGVGIDGFVGGTMEVEVSPEQLVVVKRDVDDDDVMIIGDNGEDGNQDPLGM